MTFWDHLDVMRSMLVRVAVVVVLLTIGCFFLKDWLFSVILAPRDASFVTYRLLDSVAGILSPVPDAQASVPLINTDLARQFLIHMRISFYAALVLASPYIIYQLFTFISPALYANERRYLLRISLPAYILFMLGVAVSYFIIFPLTFRFLGSYQVSPVVANMISLESYINTLVTLCIAMGVVFQLPILCWLLSRLGILSPDTMRAYRKHAIVAILILAAIITPTSDIFTLAIVSLPIYLLFEAGILISAKSAPHPL